MEMRQKTGVIVLAIVLIVLGVLYWYWTELLPRSRGPVVIPPGGGPAGEDMIAKQLQELDSLRNQLAPQGSGDPKSQLKELDALYKKSGVSPPSESDIARQLQELEELRKSQ